MTRLDANMEIIDILEDYMHENEDLRFEQVLFNLDIHKSYYRESIETLSYLKERVLFLKNLERGYDV